MNVSYEQIKAFVAVAEAGSFSAAARKLNKHRTTLGQVISNLEIEVNMTLFDRSNKFPVLTADGQALFRHAKSLHDSSIAFESLCLTVESGIESDITIYHSDLIPTELICAVMQETRRAFPHVNVHWLSRYAKDAREDLISGEADMAVVLIDAESRGASASEYIHLISLPFVAVAHPKLLPCAKQTTNIRELKKYRQLLLEEYFESDIQHTIAVSPMVQTVKNANVLKGLLSIQEGWTVLPKHMVRDELASGSLVELDIEELNTEVRFPVGIWYMNEAQSGPVRSAIIKAFGIHSK